MPNTNGGEASRGAKFLQTGNELARLSLLPAKQRRKRISVVLTLWLQICIVMNWFITIAPIVSSIHRYRPRIRSYELDAYRKREFIRRLVYSDESKCLSELRMCTRAFHKLCEMLQEIGGLRSSRNMLVNEQVGMFLHILAHHQKNRTILTSFLRSGETVSRSFHKVMDALMKLQTYLLKKPTPIIEDCTDARWNCFKNCLGALDGTYIKIRVPLSDKERYRTRRSEITTNVLGVCSPEMLFIYVLPGWEGSANDGRVLRDAISRKNGLKVPHGCYYLVDAGYANSEGFLAPFRGQRYHLSIWRQGHRPRNALEFFNMKHSSARNVIERCFGLLKSRWGILRSPSFYPIRTHNHIIFACCLLQNFIRMEHDVDPMEVELDENNDDDDHNDLICSTESSQYWNTKRMNMANEMFQAWTASRHGRA